MAATVLEEAPLTHAATPTLVPQPPQQQQQQQQWDEGAGWALGDMQEGGELTFRLPLNISRLYSMVHVTHLAVHEWLVSSYLAAATPNVTHLKVIPCADAKEAALPLAAHALLTSLHAAQAAASACATYVSHLQAQAPRRLLQQLLLPSPDQAPTAAPRADPTSTSPPSREGVLRAAVKHLGSGQAAHGVSLPELLQLVGAHLVGGGGVVQASQALGGYRACWAQQPDGPGQAGIPGPGLGSGFTFGRGPGPGLPARGPGPRPSLNLSPAPSPYSSSGTAVAGCEAGGGGGSPRTAAAAAAAPVGQPTCLPPPLAHHPAPGPPWLPALVRVLRLLDWLSLRLAVSSSQQWLALVQELAPGLTPDQLHSPSSMLAAMRNASNVLEAAREENEDSEGRVRQVQQLLDEMAYGVMETWEWVQWVGVGRGEGEGVGHHQHRLHYKHHRHQDQQQEQQQGKQQQQQQGEHQQQREQQQQLQQQEELGGLHEEHEALGVGGQRHEEDVSDEAWEGVEEGQGQVLGLVCSVALQLDLELKLSHRWLLRLHQLPGQLRSMLTHHLPPPGLSQGQGQGQVQAVLDAAVDACHQALEAVRPSLTPAAAWLATPQVAALVRQFQQQQGGQSAEAAGSSSAAAGGLGTHDLWAQAVQEACRQLLALRGEEGQGHHLGQGLDLDSNLSLGQWQGQSQGQGQGQGQRQGQGLGHQGQGLDLDLDLGQGQRQEDEEAGPGEGRQGLLSPGCAGGLQGHPALAEPPAGCDEPVADRPSPSPGPGHGAGQQRAGHLNTSTSLTPANQPGDVLQQQEGDPTASPSTRGAAAGEEQLGIARHMDGPGWGPPVLSDAMVKAVASQLPRLSHLVLHRCELLTDAALAALSQHPGLHLLQLCHGLQITLSGIARLLRITPDVTVCTVTPLMTGVGQALTGRDGGVGLGGASKLRKVELRGCKQITHDGAMRVMRQLAAVGRSADVLVSDRPVE
ncbi:hypothetical protein QJQ45_027304 [Haematococcus lacustris]|nr:hypothetical protein QJQ45_027304 [Haematococcus lacustris]